KVAPAGAGAAGYCDRRRIPACAGLDSIGPCWDIEAFAAAPGEAPRVRGIQKVMTENTAPQGALDGLRVMVIDDSKTIRRTAETLLKREGCEVVTAADGFEALAKIADQQPQIIFVDIMMPR